MSDQPFFTVAVPTYNRCQLLRVCMTRILEQTFEDFELLVSDNASPDDTEKVVRSFDDPRVRYHRRDENEGPWPNFRDAAALARGRFVILHQDDDQLHRRFLERCLAAYHADPEVTLFATPYWRGDPGDGYRAICMPDITEGSADYAARDRVVYAEGAAAAVTYFYAGYFRHPGCALRTDALRDAGGYLCKQGLSNDTVSQARVLMRGKLAYDPRPGSVFHYHGDSYSQTEGGSRERYLRIHRMYHFLVNDFEARHIDWRSLLRRRLERVNRATLVHALREWARYDAPRAMRDVGVQAVSQKTGRTRLKLRSWFVRQLGARKAMRYAFSRQVDL